MVRIGSIVMLRIVFLQHLPPGLRIDKDETTLRAVNDPKSSWNPENPVPCFKKKLMPIGPTNFTGYRSHRLGHLFSHND